MRSALVALACVVGALMALGTAGCSKPDTGGKPKYDPSVPAPGATGAPGAQRGGKGVGPPPA